VLARAEGRVDVAALRDAPLDAPEWRALIHDLTIHESYFFRDFEVLEERILPELVATRRAAEDRRLSVWSAGCAAGEEPYSVAMELTRLLPDRADWRLTLLGTDLDEHALAQARAAGHGRWALRRLPAWARFAHFPHGRLDEGIRRMVSFASLNLVADPFPAGVDLVLCRNVLMYFPERVREAVARRLGEAVAVGGWLALSPLDPAPGEGFEPLAGSGGRYFHKVPAGSVASVSEEDAPPPLPLPPGPEDPLTRARAHADRGELEAARALCRSALARRPLDAEAYLLLAAVEEERGDPEAAIAALRRAIYIVPDSADAHFHLGALLVRCGRTEAGRRSLATAEALAR
jgi:chemotaxis protein methyltransferase CheR